MLKKYNKLIPELQKWNDGDGVDIEGWLANQGNYELAIAYAEFFWPEFIEYDGCIFRGSVNTEIYQQTIESLEGDKTSTEALMNHEHIVYLFNVKQTPSTEQIIYLGKKLQEIWKRKLECDFPDKKITVCFSEENCKYPVDYEITFYQENHE